jgi:hypothetical protein
LLDLQVKYNLNTLPSFPASEVMYFIPGTPFNALSKGIITDLIINFHYRIISNILPLVEKWKETVMGRLTTDNNS